MEKLLNYRGHGIDIDLANCLPHSRVQTVVRRGVNVEYWEEPHVILDPTDPQSVQNVRIRFNHATNHHVPVRFMIRPAESVYD